MRGYVVASDDLRHSDVTTSRTLPSWKPRRGYVHDRSLARAVRIEDAAALEDQLEGLAHDLLEVSVGTLVRERRPHLLQLGDELCRDRDVEAAQLRRERLDDLGRPRRRYRCIYSSAVGAARRRDRAAGCRARALMPLSSSPRSRSRDLAAKLSNEKHRDGGRTPLTERATLKAWSASARARS
jgi:hypothetical protein